MLTVKMLRELLENLPDDIEISLAGDEYRGILRDYDEIPNILINDKLDSIVICKNSYSYTFDNNSHYSLFGDNPNFLDFNSVIGD